MTPTPSTLPQAETLDALSGDPRPAWLWPAEGGAPLWANAAAGLFGAKLKPSGLKRAEPAVPMKGQINRILRLGLVGRPTPSRMQFLAGNKPLSATCQCTRLQLDARTPALLVVGVDPIDPDILAAAAEAEMPPVEPEAVVEEAVAEDAPGLTALVDRLAGHEQLFEPLDETDDTPLAIEEDPEPEPLAEEDEARFAADTSEDADPMRAGLWKVTGRGLSIPRASYDEEEEAVSDEALERASRYNFDELSRILTERVGREEPPAPEPVEEEPEPARASGELVALSEESLVLNRLPIGILIFRDQDIVFANRALVDLTGYENATTLRSLGLAAIFPTIDGSEPAGPVTHLVRRDGEKVAVEARLNAVTWQGRPGFMLSARANDAEPLRETEVQQFAALWARIAGFDFVAADQRGIITQYAAGEAGGDEPAEGAPLDVLVAHADHGALRDFLGLPARFAGAARPAVTLKGARAGRRLTLFALGRAGIVTGYFGLTDREGERPASEGKAGISAAVLARITRGLRRPLNTIAGFSELMATEAFGPLSNPRYLEYARDIGAAGAEIGDLADELDDYVRLAEGAVALSPADIDIGTLLAECLVRVRGQAGKARVLLRSAISERLPLVRADAATLRQAVLNMLASAISEAGEGSKVVLSAQIEEDGSVSIHVRDGAKGPGTLAERFVVFRDGVAADGTERLPSQSSIGLTLTRSLVAVNACSLSLDPASESGTLMTLTIPASLVVRGSELGRR